MDTSIHDFAFDAIDPNIVYVTAARHEIGLDPTENALGIFKSTDLGETWKEINKGLPTKEVEIIVVSQITPGKLFVGTDKGVFVSANAGNSWEKTSLTKHVHSVILDPVDDSIYAGTEEGLYWSNSNGDKWQELESVPRKLVSSLAMDKDGSVLYAAVNDVGIFRGVKE